jgi:hypothetical protein
MARRRTYHVVPAKASGWAALTHHDYAIQASRLLCSAVK